MTSDVFGSGGGERLAAELGTPLLGQVPLTAGLRESGDEGVPLVLRNPSDPAAEAIAAIAGAIDEQRVGGFTRTLPLVS
jgi:ATP-binding protein involved in chromosome partitioning